MTRQQAFVGPVSERTGPLYETPDTLAEEGCFWDTVDSCIIQADIFNPMFGKAASEFLNGNSR